MNLAKHMEVIFVATAILACSVAYAKPSQGVTDPGVASYASVARQAPGEVQKVIVVAKRLP